MISWWRHQMETFSALLAICTGNSPVSGEFPSQRPVTPGFDVFFDLDLNKRLSKQSKRWWFETQYCSLWRHRSVIIMRLLHIMYIISGRCQEVGIDFLTSGGTAGKLALILLFPGRINKSQVCTSLSIHLSCDELVRHHRLQGAWRMCTYERHKMMTSWKHFLR